MNLEEAEQIANKVKEILSPYCEEIEIVGSIRRRKPTVHDIDIVLIDKPSTWLILGGLLSSIGSLSVNGNKVKRLWYGNKQTGIAIDIYFATKLTWLTLLLIRTGSKENNIMLCSIANRKGWQLKANGEGLINEKGESIVCHSEMDIYKALAIPFQQPTNR